MKISILKIKGIKIIYGNVYIRCHPCHVTLARNKPNGHTNNATNKTENNDKANINIDSTVNDYDDSCNSSGDENQHFENKKDNDNEITENNSKKVDSSTNELKKNQNTKYLSKNSAEYKETQLISYGRKATGKYIGCWDTHNNENAPIDFEREI